MAILTRKKTPNGLMVDDSTSDDHSTIAMHPDKLKELKLFNGDTVLIRGKKRKSTVGVVVADDSVDGARVQMSKVARSNLRVRLGDVVTISSLPDVKAAKSISVVPFEDTIEGLGGDIFDVFVKPYFKDAFRPLKVGDHFIARGGMRAVEFKVTNIEAADGEEEFCTVGPQTVINCDFEPLSREDDDRLDEVGYDDVGGCNRQLAQIRELVELPLRHPQIFRTLGIPPPKGVLMYGPPGSGKTLIARAVAAETGASFHVLNGPEIMSKLAGESEANLRKVMNRKCGLIA